MRLQVVSAVAAWAVTSACQSLPVTRNLWSRDADYKELSEKLSNAAKVYYPGSAEFEKANTRWSNLETPTVNIVVVPSTENDVVETVREPYPFRLFLCRSVDVFNLPHIISLDVSSPAHGQCLLMLQNASRVIPTTS